MRQLYLCHLQVTFVMYWIEYSIGFYNNIYNKSSLITKKRYTYNVVYTNTPHTDEYNLKLDYKEFDHKKIQ